ncbi:hypothetical protein AAF712_006377 [Marasmius tenuissimus]|uniref:BHLH domain-containing protein n=1 Tax=Marasmius tenuissimus TaxID=585030 RepID=A0ABR2ZZK2_9AGAR
MSMEFETVSHSPFVIDQMDNSNSFLMESNMDSFLQYPPSSPHPTTPRCVIPGTSSPMALSLPLGGGEYSYSPESYEHRPLSPVFEGTTPSGRHSRGSNHTPPPAIPYAATIPRSQRYNPIAVPTHIVAAPSTTRANVRRARSTRSNTLRSNDDSDNEEDDIPSSGGVDSRREAVRRQRIESEQKRRDELRDGYTKLREALPSMSQKCSKVVLLDRASSHIKSLSAMKSNLELRLKASEDEVNRLRSVNEALMLGTATQRHAARHGIPPSGNIHPQQF